MHYLNQLEYPQMEYKHNMDEGGAGEHNTVAAAGCGPCSLCMVVEMLTPYTFTLDECIELSYSVRANRKPGTDLKLLAPAVAEKFGLAYTPSSNVGELIEHLQKGGMAVANSGGDREGYTGVFTHGGHYIAVLSYADGEFCILDPSWKEGKFEEEGRTGKVRVVYPYVYCAPEVLAKDCENRTPSYYLFARKK